MPKVSVIMPLYNAEKHLRGALESVIAQTFTDYELIVIDDCSTDGTAAILDTFDDPRIQRLRNERNLGIVGALNRGLDVARGVYIARMDGDDLAYPERFAAQVAYLDAHPEVGLLGTKYVHIDDQGAYVYEGVEAPPPPEPSSRGYLRWSLLWMTTIQHPTAVIRRSVIEDHGLRYDPAFFTAEDYELWARIGQVSVVERLPQVYLQYRVNPDGISITKRTRQLETHYTITQRELNRLMDEALPEDLTRFLFRMVIPQHQDPAEVIRGVDVIAALRLFCGFGIAFWRGILI